MLVIVSSAAVSLTLTTVTFSCIKTVDANVKYHSHNKMLPESLTAPDSPGMTVWN